MLPFSCTCVLLRNYWTLSYVTWRIFHSDTFPQFIPSPFFVTQYTKLLSGFAICHPRQRQVPLLVLNIFHPHVPSYFISISVSAHVALPCTATGFTIVLYILILTALLTALILNISLWLQIDLLRAAILDYFDFVTCTSISKILNSLNTCLFIIRPCSKFVILLFIFLYYVLLSFISSSLLIASSLICVTITWIALTDRPSINKSSAYAMYHLTLLKIAPFILISILPITFSSTILNSAVGSALPCLKPLYIPSALVIRPWIFTFPLESCIIIFIKFTNFFGIQTSSKVSYDCVVFIES